MLRVIVLQPMIVWAADKAALAPGQKITAVNNMVFSMDRLIKALASPAPVQLSIEDGDELMPATLNYTDGLRYPRLPRVHDHSSVLAPFADSSRLEFGA